MIYPKASKLRVYFEASKLMACPRPWSQCLIQSLGANVLPKASEPMTDPKLRDYQLCLCPRSQWADQASELMTRLSLEAISLTCILGTHDQTKPRS